ncbi:fluoride efflux transporter CrcB [Sinomonas sp. JGH33]|uniref:Fluoride-specific ion channel FluC n=1 Tax=Sinomonas terricola TaxID=3110330 RepID=A0ABU5T743_9MICC|nr:fluoride efflux transporter CrcB [Sinomonas sp. JGH33]MEA5455408.1 fluoride efflux transporter CrcB [Sinomonas sp. JGH33]
MEPAEKEAAARQRSQNPDEGTLGARAAHRPLHLNPRYVLIVVGGGIAGALCRYWLGITLPAPGDWPLPTLVINLAGAFVLGILLEALARRGPDEGGLRVLRLLIGTGFIGAFTTYSTFAVESVKLFAAGRGLEGLGYVAATVLGGILASALGIWAAAYRHARSAR